MAENEVDRKKAFDAIARIIGEREHAEITVKAIRVGAEGERERRGAGGYEGTGSYEETGIHDNQCQE